MDSKKVVKLNKALRNLFCVIDEEEILQFNDLTGKFSLNGKELSQEEVEGLKAEAQTILNTKLFPLLVKEMKSLANKEMYDKAKSIDDMVFGKAALWTLDVFKRKLENLKKVTAR